MYLGVRCELNHNECVSNPCLNDAVCVDDVNKFSCECKPGFTGKIVSRPTLFSFYVSQGRIRSLVGSLHSCGIAQWLERRSMAGEIFLACAMTYS